MHVYLGRLRSSSGTYVKETYVQLLIPMIPTNLWITCSAGIQNPNRLLYGINNALTRNMVMRDSHNKQDT